MYKTYNMR